MRTRLKNKILKDTGIEIPEDAIFVRRNLSWNNKSAGCMAWFFVIKNSGVCIGSSDGIRDLLKSKKIQSNRNNLSGDVELHSS